MCAHVYSHKRSKVGLWWWGSVTVDFPKPSVGLGYGRTGNDRGLEDRVKRSTEGNYKAVLESE